MARQVMTSTMVLLNGTISGHIQNWLAKHPNTAILSATVSKGDRPWDSDTTTLKLTWSEDL